MGYAIKQNGNSFLNLIIDNIEELENNNADPTINKCLQANYDTTRIQRKKGLSCRL